MINIIVLYVASYRRSLHTDKLNPLPSTFSNWLLPDVLGRQCRSNLHISWLKNYKLSMFCYIWTAVTWCYIPAGLQWLDQGDKWHHYHHLENLRSHFIRHSTSPCNLGQNL